LKNNNLTHFKNFPEECDIFRNLTIYYGHFYFILFLNGPFSRSKYQGGQRSFDPSLSLGEGRGEVCYTYKPIIMQIQKSTVSP